MPFKLIPSPHFIKEAKALAKKYASFKADLESIGQELLANPTTGESPGKDCYKVRMAIASKGQGKSGGARLITCVKIVQENIFLLAIYDKSEMGNIDDKTLKRKLKFLKKSRPLGAPDFPQCVMGIEPLLTNSKATLNKVALLLYLLPPGGAISSFVRHEAGRECTRSHYIHDSFISNGGQVFYQYYLFVPRSLPKA